ncbi:MAG: AAA family ATPase [Candidatus Acidiferrales bacterium]
MISGIQFLRSVGQFDYVTAGALELRQYVLVYAENGRGKTTLAAILRSLATGDPLPIRERRRLAAAHPPQVVLHCSVGQTPAVFENGAWNRTFPEIVIFDDRFVDDNVYSGLSIEPRHRQNLHELVIGAQGVALSRRLQVLVQQIEEDNANLRLRAAAISSAIRGAFSVDEFCDLPTVEEIDAEIQLAERSLAAAQRQDAVRDTPGFDALGLPAFDVADLTEVLRLDLPNLDAVAAAHVQEHFRDIGHEGEAWVADGMGRIGDGENARDICPFCAQDLRQSAIFGQYREYFSEAYTQLKQRISGVLTAVTIVHPRDLPGAFERALRVAAERRRFWSEFCDLPQVALETERLMEEWHSVRDGIMAILQAKQAAPLERMEIPGVLAVSMERFAADRRGVEVLNEQLQRANAEIMAVKQRAAIGDSGALLGELARLGATRVRHSAEVAVLCEEYLTARAAKALTEGLRGQAQGELERYRMDEFPNYQRAMNDYLTRFGAGYRVSRVAAVDTRGGPTCNYEVLINDVPVQISGGDELAEPAFRNTLSSGDRNALALAFFFTYIDRDPHPERKVVVIDDPVSSLDEHRSLTTVQELRRMGEHVSQLIILSHDKGFLSRIWLKIDSVRCSAIRLERDGDGSNIVAWDVGSDLITAHDKNHALLRSYLGDGPDANSRAVAQALRPVLEAFLRTAYPEHFTCSPGAMRRFIGHCRERLRGDSEILDLRDTEELEDLVEYANLFHHDTNRGWQEVVINDGALRGFVERVLRFTKRAGAAAG